MPIYKGTNEVTSGNLYKGSTKIENGYKQLDPFYVNTISITIIFVDVISGATMNTTQFSAAGTPGASFVSFTRNITVDAGRTFSVNPTVAETGDTGNNVNATITGITTTAALLNVSGTYPTSATNVTLTISGSTTAVPVPVAPVPAPVPVPVPTPVPAPVAPPTTPTPQAPVPQPVPQPVAPVAPVPVAPVPVAPVPVPVAPVPVPVPAPVATPCFSISMFRSLASPTDACCFTKGGSQYFNASTISAASQFFAFDSSCSTLHSGTAYIMPANQTGYYYTFVNGNKTGGPTLCPNCP
jgi:hypothetical protein